MKATLIGFLSLTLLSTAAFAKDTTANLKISGWHCEDCSDETVDAVKKLKGVKEATADSDKSMLKVTYDDSKLKRADIVAAVKSLHFKVVK